MKLSATLLDSPESATNRPAAYRRALENANRGARFESRRHLSTKAVALLLAFLAGATVGLWFAGQVMK